jgi:hypothetical protein
MRTSIKALWKGMIPVRDVIVRRAIRRKEDLIVDVGKESLVIKYDNLKAPRMEIPVRDNFSSNMQKLFYYTVVKAKEEEKQLKLL